MGRVFIAGVGRVTVGPATAGRVERRGRAPVVALGSHVPEWVHGWCRWSGRGLDMHAEPGIGPTVPPFAAELTRAVAALSGRTVWLTHEPADRRPARVLVAVRDLPDDADVLAEAVAVTTYLGATLVIAHAVPVSFAERSVGLDYALNHGRSVLASAAEAVGPLPPSCPMASRLVRAHPHELVGETLDADLLVLGGPRNNERGPGVVLNGALHHAPCPLLLAPRPAHVVPEETDVQLRSDAAATVKVASGSTAESNSTSPRGRSLVPRKRGQPTKRR